MELILLQRVEKLGQMGDVVKVKPGYGRNFLLPRGKAIRATQEKIEEFKTKRSQLEANNLKLKKEAEAVAEKMRGLSLVILRSAGESGHLYGSIRSQDIVEGVSSKGFTISRSQVILDHPIKTLGIHKIRIALHPEVSVYAHVNIALTEEEAKTQEIARAASPSLEA
ncbi:50S ribosomal protein L9 [Caedimonas varicaedens]|uniref:Large ribosomal subunit protein bL9 n=1 Tax=Caedimonas varicaedens TaxID=1629334 RepID=A0A0K8ME66_9PROT|nr:50S ribosomal protein L9 [Caedimonas varicaedens]